MSDNRVILNIHRTVFSILADNVKCSSTWHYAAGLLQPHKPQVVVIPDSRLDDAEKLVALGLFVKSGRHPNKFRMPRTTVFAVYESELSGEN
jgi:hypothetical protein